MLYLTAKQVRTLLKARLQDFGKARGQQAKLAEKIGVSPPFISAIMSGDKDPSGAVLDFLGLERVVLYRAKSLIRQSAKHED